MVYVFLQTTCTYFFYEIRFNLKEKHKPQNMLLEEEESNPSLRHTLLGASVIYKAVGELTFIQHLLLFSRPQQVEIVTPPFYMRKQKRKI